MPSTFIALAVGNTRTRVGLVREFELDSAMSHENADPGAIVSAAVALGDGPIVISSVNNPLAERLESLFRDEGREVHRMGRDLPFAIANALEDDSTVGQDRLLSALGAFARAKQACVVVDAGTAVTVDFVDGEGVFQGGAILPGLRMMLDAMHARTAALPRLNPEAPSASQPFGKDTARAMQLGVFSAVRGAVRLLLERYAEAYEAYPQVIATGGDAPALFDGDEVVEHVVPDLQLLGIMESCRRAVEEDDEGEPA